MEFAFQAVAHYFSKQAAFRERKNGYPKRSLLFLSSYNQLNPTGTCSLVARWLHHISEALNTSREACCRTHKSRPAAAEQTPKPGPQNGGGAGGWALSLHFAAFFPVTLPNHHSSTCKGMENTGMHLIIIAASTPQCGENVHLGCADGASSLCDSLSHPCFSLLQ